MAARSATPDALASSYALRRSLQQNANSLDSRNGMRLYANWVSVLVLTACAHQPATERPGDLIPIEERFLAVLRPHAGCYTLSFGEWQVVPGGMSLAYPQFSPAFLPPRVVRLDTLVQYGHLRLVPPADSATGFGFAYWYRREATDSLFLNWEPYGANGMSWSTFSVALVPATSDLRGTAQMKSDVRGPPLPFREVTARRTQCTSG
jgi:hypothetical protein